MKKFFFLLGFIASCLTLAQNRNVTFQLDLGGLSPSAAGVHIAGNFQGPAGVLGGNWQPGASAMTLQASGFYTLTVSIPDGLYEYKFLNGNAWGQEEAVPPLNQVGNGNTNRWVLIQSDTVLPPLLYAGTAPQNQKALSLIADMSNENQIASTVHVAGNFQGWQPGQTPMALLDSSSVLYRYLRFDPVNDTLEFKCVNGNSWGQDETVPAACARNNNRFYTGTTDTVYQFCFGACSSTCQPDSFNVSLQVDLRSAPGFDPATDSVDVAGVFNGWPGSFNAATRMSDANGDTIYNLTLRVPEPLLEYKVRYHNAQGVNWEPGANKQVFFTGDTLVPIRCFGRDTNGLCGPPPDTSFVTLQVDLRNEASFSPGQDSVDIAGAFSGWGPFFNSSLAMRDPDGDTIYTITVYRAEPLFEYKARFHNANGVNWESGANKLVRFDRDTVIPVRCFNADTVGACFQNPAPPTLPRYLLGGLSNLDSNGVPFLLGQRGWLEATVHSIDFRGGNGTQFFVYDSTGALGVFSSSDVSGYGNVQRGDRLYMEGTLGQFRGLTQFEPDSIRILGQVALRAPDTVNQLNENTEGDYLYLANFSVIDTLQWPAAGNDANVDITNGIDTLVMRIDRDTDIDGTAAPQGPFSFTGAGSQFSTAPKLDDGYQVLPSALGDFAFASVPVDTFWVTLQVDLSGPGSFDPASDSVDMAGPFNGWPNVFDPNYRLSDPDGDTVYTLSVYAPEPQLTYKVRFHNASGLNWEPGLDKVVNFTSDTLVPVRCFGSDSLGACPGIPDTSNVTVQVDMGNVAGFDPANDPVDIAGFFSGWNPAYNASFALSDPDGDLVYTGSIRHPEPLLEYKARFFSGGVTNWEPGANKFVRFDGDTIVPPRCFGSDSLGRCPLPPTPSLANYPIGALTGENALGVADSLGVECRLRGTVMSDDFRGGTGYSFFLYDATGGIHVFALSDIGSLSNIQLGDSLRVMGKIGQFNGLTEIQVDSLAVEANGRPVKAPRVVPQLNESTEADLLRLQGYRLINPGNWPSSGNNATLLITNGLDTLRMRIDQDTDIDGRPAPAGTFDLLGIGSQFDNSSPYLEGYQILPRAYTDILPLNLPSLYLSELMPQSTAPTPLNANWFELRNGSGQMIGLNGYSWRNNAASSPVQFNTTAQIPAGQSAVVLNLSAPQDTSWLRMWRQENNGMLLLLSGRDFANFGPFDPLGDQFFLFDPQGRLLNQIRYQSSDLQAGRSLEYGANGSLLGAAQDGVNGAYRSRNSEIGSPGDLRPVSLEAWSQRALELYPNPSEGKVTFLPPGGQPCQLRLYDAWGHLLWEGESQVGPTPLHWRDLAPGLYILQASAEGQSWQQRLIVR